MNRMNRMKRMYTVHGEYEGCDVMVTWVVVMTGRRGVF